jgi:hypothetical protein
MNDQDRRAKALRLLKLPVAQLEGAFARLPVSEIQEIEGEAGQLAQAAAFLGEYAGYRGAYGCGDHGHADAVHQASKKVKRVRKALGYTYP